MIPTWNYSSLFLHNVHTCITPTSKQAHQLIQLKATPEQKYVHVPSRYKRNSHMKDLHVCVLEVRCYVGQPSAYSRQVISIPLWMYFKRLQLHLTNISRCVKEKTSPELILCAFLIYIPWAPPPSLWLCWKSSSWWAGNDSLWGAEKMIHLHDLPRVRKICGNGKAFWAFIHAHGEGFHPYSYTSLTFCL